MTIEVKTCERKREYRQEPDYEIRSFYEYLSDSIESLKRKFSVKGKIAMI
jgi:hypothetical protein